MNDKTSIDINFRAIFESILAKLWLIVLVAVLCAGAAYVRIAFFVEPLYASTATLYVGSNSDKPSNTDILVSESLAKDYEEIIGRPAVLQKVIDQLDLNMNPATLRKYVSVTNVADTRILDIKVSTTDPVKSMEIANAICAVASEQFVEITHVDYVSIIDEGSVSSVPSNINLLLSMILAVIAGVFVCLFVIVLRCVLDDKIKTPGDIEHYLGLSVLGTVPFNKELQAQGAGASAKKKHRRKTA